ncbi:MAG: hypothetical protein OEQ30_06255 [Gammaproteobacteria bacterium]|jgi:hypothetical protein|nr:hypothetical protein [Gammaproteobacteria bacterium]MDH3864385.1 hypothetical protein [Gammaproteobacteria bacterium]NCF58612.1 hypothetical protein [Gammaproteobacteria bacterium]
MIRTDKGAWPWRALWLIPVSVFAVLTIVATGGGGGGDDISNPISGGDDPGPVNILPTYNFFLTNLQDTDGGLLTASLGSGLTVSIDIDGLLANTIDLSVNASNEVTFLSYAARAGSRFDLVVSSGGLFPLDGTIAVILTEDLAFDFIGAPPTSGAFDVVIPAETISVTVVASGVQLSLSGGEVIPYTWDEFENLLDDDAQEPWLRRASLAGGAFEFLYENFFNVADILDELEFATLTNQLVESCDMFTGTPPPGILAEGEITVTWTGSGELSPGDDFSWQFNQCWIDESNDPIDDLINGTILLENYTETVDFSTNTLLDIGFGGLSGESGGIIFDLTVSETVEENGVFTIAADDVITITGGFAMIIQAP